MGHTHLPLVHVPPCKNGTGHAGKRKSICTLEEKNKGLEIQSTRVQWVAFPSDVVQTISWVREGKATKDVEKGKLEKRCTTLEQRPSNENGSNTTLQTANIT